MSDYTVRVKGLPTDLLFGDNEHILRAKLWSHFQMVLAREEMYRKLKSGAVDPDDRSGGLPNPEKF